MKVTQVKYKTTVTAQGRNGQMKQTGIYILAGEESIMLAPINSRLKVGNCHLEIPRETLLQVLETIKQTAK